ncbi:hypothetical protein EG329_010818 [Mollisiaceae sp. DMI_Dod_QoI]|nr:hypothetical protein EG329_010818 [Helotiales sp. DMI_Dod_QoI]
MAEAFMGLTEAVLDLVIPTGQKLSPDGRSVIYSTRLKWNHKKGEHLCPSLWHAETGTSKSARKLTDGSYNDRMPQWSPDGRSVAFLSDRGKRGKARAIYLLALDENEPKALTPAEDERQIVKFEFSPDGKNIVFISSPGKSAEVRAKEEAKDDACVWGQNWDYANLRILSTEKGTIKYLFNKNCHVTDFAQSDNGAEVAIVTYRTPHIESKYLHGATISILKIGSGEVREVCHVPRGVSSLIWSGSALYFLTNNIPEQDTSGLAVYSINLSDKDYIYQKVAHGEENCALGLAKCGKDILVYVEQGMEDQLRLLNGNILLSQKKRINEFDAVFNRDSNETVLATTQGDVNHPTEVFSITASGKTTQLSDHGSTFAGKEFGNCSFIECQTLDGKERLEGLYLVLTQHAGLDDKPQRPLPTVVLIHGGPYSRITDAFDVWDPLHLLIPNLLVEGYGILIPNYRGSSSRGERFANYMCGGVGIYDEPDIVAMTQHAIEEGYADKTQLVAGGWSQGGHLSFLASVRNGTHGFGWRFKGVIAGAGVTDWDSLILTSDVGYMQAQSAGGSPWKLEKADVKTRAGSALWEFKQASKEGRIPPLLILHGEKDERVPITQAWGFRRALDEAGLPFEFVTYPREGHFFTERKHIEDLMRRMGRFIRMHLS